jgi:predicted phosphate transport protein (TIGR00153 family)
MAWIDKLVGRSPIGPMQEHMRVAVACAHQVVPLVEAMVSGDAEAIRAKRAEIDRLEHRADDIKHEIRSNLPRRLMLAMERRDMLEILDYQDSIADVTQDIAELVDQRGMQLPGALAEPVRSLSARVIAACDQAQRIIDELDELVETGFGGREVARVEQMISELARIESETDVLLDSACRTLFGIEDQLGISTVYWHQILLWIADLADYAERVGNRLRLLIAN